jgi:ABC-type branched-subunit amino acid transport system ATPase component
MTEKATDNVLEVNNIEVIYNKVVQALRGLSLAVPRGQIVALLGSNGAGKSTTLKAVSGLLALEDGELESGSILFNGQSTAALAPQQLVRSGLSHVMEGRRVFEDLTVEENLVAATYALTGRAGAAQPDFDLVYTYFPRLHERRKGLAGYLSGGEQQMLAIGRALIAQPQLILLDEPSLGLSRSWSKTSSPSSRASTPSAAPACCWWSRTPPWPWPWRTAATSWRTARSSSTAAPSAWPTTPTCASSISAWAGLAKPRASKTSSTTNAASVAVVSAHNPLWRFAPSPFSRLAARCGKGDATSAAGRPLRGGRWPGPCRFYGCAWTRRAMDH